MSREYPDGFSGQSMPSEPMDAERRDGPRYCEAIRGARAMRERAFRTLRETGLRVWPTRAKPLERWAGIPAGWIGR